MRSSRYSRASLSAGRNKHTQLANRKSEVDARAPQANLKNVFQPRDLLTHTAQSMSGLIVFIHGFRGGEEHWKYVPRIVAPAFASFEVANQTYSAEYDSFADLT